MKKKTQNWQKVYFIVPSIFFFLPNIMYIMNAWFVRYRADDFCFSGTFREFGFLGGLEHFYLTISNRFSAFMLWSFSDLFGENAIRIFPMVAIILTSISIYILAKNLAAKLSLQNPTVFAFLVSQLLTFFFLYLSPTIHQSVYWRAAMVHYFLPFPVLLLMLNYVLDTKGENQKNKIRIIIFFFLSFFMAGLSESYAALQGGAFSMVLILSLINIRQKKRSRAIYFSILAILGTIAALMVMIISPGNTLKFTLTDQAQDLMTIISISFNSAWSFMYYTLRGQWLPFIILFTIATSLSLFLRMHLKTELDLKKLYISFLLVPLIAFFLIFCISAPTAYGMTAYPENRVLMLAEMVLSIGVFCEGYLAGLILKTYLPMKQVFRHIAGTAVVLISIYALFSIPDIKTMIDFYQKRADLWDKQQQEIVIQIGEGKKDLVVSALDAHAEIAEMRDYSTFWVNVCTAQYYNVDSITAVER